MINLLRGIGVLVIAAAVGVASAEPTKTASNGGSKDNGSAKAADPKQKPKKLGQTEALTKAIAELQKEFKEFADKPDGGSLKTNADYFKGLPEDTTVEDVLTVLASNMSGPPAQVAYVKLQLTSALPAKVEGPQQTKLAYQAFQSAPRPIPAFGSDPQSKSQLDRALQGVNDDTKGQLEDAFDKEKKKSMIDDFNGAILSYRTVLYGRLPLGPDTIMLGFGDLIERLEAGADNKGMFTAVMSDVRSWSAVDAKPDQLQGMLSAVTKLKNYKAKTTSYSGKISKNKSTFAWATNPVQLNQKELEGIEKNLREAINTPGGGGLKFKDDGNDKKKK